MTAETHGIQILTLQNLLADEFEKCVRMEESRIHIETMKNKFSRPCEYVFHLFFALSSEDEVLEFRKNYLGKDD